MAHSNFNFSNGFLKVSGPDAKKLLQGQLTCDVLHVTSMQSCIGAHCNPQGRIISLFRLLKIEEDFYLCMPRDLISTAQAALKKYALFYQVKLQDASDDFFCIGTTNFIANKKGVYCFPIHDHRYLLIGENNLQETIINELSEAGQIINFATWKALDITDGFPAIYPATSEKILPHEINLHECNAISFSKGCYTGQEIIARMHYRGKLKKRMYRARINNPTELKPGAEIYRLSTATACGIVVDSCHEKDNNYKTLIILDEADVKNKHLVLDPKSTLTFTILQT